MGGSSKRQVVGYKYYEDQHIVLALTNFDHISHIWFANKLAWAGIETGETDGWGLINIDKKSLFGGEKREGGVAGRVYVGMGWPDQPLLSRLVSRLGSSLMPAYRGVVSLFFDDFYFGNNPYIKELKVRAQAIHKLSDGSPQWYDEKAEVLTFRQELTEIYTKDLSSTSSDTIYDTSLGGPIVPPPGSLVINADPSDILTITLRDNALYTAWTVWAPSSPNYPGWRTSITMEKDGDISSVGFTGNYDTQIEAFNAFEPVVLSGGSVYKFFFTDTPIDDNTGGLSISVEVKKGVRNGDINPIHFIRECHTDRIWGGRYPESKMGDTYISAADTIYAEGLGVSFLFTEEIKWREIIEEVARHIDAIPYQDPDTGLMEIKLIRDDYDIETIPLLDPSNSDLERINDPFEAELFNTVIIEFWNRETGENDSITLSDAAAVDMVGFPNTKTYKYSGLTNKLTATIVGNRDLARSSRPYYQGRVKTNRSVANLKPGDVFKLSSPDDDISLIIGRVTKRSESGLLNGDIILEFGEDIFGQSFTTFTMPPESAWVDPIGSPKNFSYQTVFEVPYYFVVQDQGEANTAAINEDACYFGFAGAEPLNGAHLDYDLYVYPDGTTQAPDPEFSITTPFTPFAVVSADVDDPTEATIPVETLSRMDSVRENQIVFVGSVPDMEREAIVLDGPVADGDTTLTVKRGVIDTVPKPITAGTILFFAETFSGSSETEYTIGETVEGYGVPSNGQGDFSGPYTYHDLEMAGRFNKPYPPANLKYDGFYDHEVDNDAEIDGAFTWVHRDRVTQSDNPVDWYDNNSVGPEPGTTYLFEAYGEFDGTLDSAPFFSENVGLVTTYTFDVVTNPIPPGKSRVVFKLWTVRDGVMSLQSADISLNLMLAPSGVTATYLGPTAPSDLNASEVP